MHKPVDGQGKAGFRVDVEGLRAAFDRLAGIPFAVQRIALHHVQHIPFAQPSQRFSRAFHPGRRFGQVIPRLQEIPHRPAVHQGGTGNRQVVILHILHLLRLNSGHG